LEARAGASQWGSGLVLSFLRRPANSTDWNQQELAEFYRVESALLQGGLSITTDRGISDEGDPWFVFCRADDERADDEEVIAHFARIDREYLIVSNLHSGVARGSDFRHLIRQMIESHPLLLPIKRNPNQKMFLHPAALLAAIIASAYFLSNEKDSTSGNSSLDETKNASTSSVTQQLGILAAASLAAIWLEHQPDSVFKFLESTLVFQGNASSDDKAIHVAETAHDFASLDTAIMQAVRDLSNSNLLAPQDGNDHENVATALGTQANSTLGNGPDGNNAHSDPIPNDSDSAVASGNPQPVIPAKDVAPSILIASQLTSSPQPSSSLGTSVDASEAAVQLAAVQLADSDTHTASIQPVAPPGMVSTVKAFLHHTPLFYVAVSGSNTTIVDTHLSDAASPDFGVLSWHLSDGSTVSIVGIIPHHHATSGAA
jgi:hypothetical protein